LWEKIDGERERWSEGEMERGRDGVRAEALLRKNSGWIFLLI